MSDWTAGYTADIDYTYGYYPELNPLRPKFPFLGAGLEAPKIETACELGFGQGLSAVIHAAASGAKWYGTDFNPSQARFAQNAVAAAGLDAHFYDDSFADFCARPELPEFDYIGLHGIWSWINDENRNIIVDFLNRKLRPGGVLYISYNTQPGWAAMVPMRQMLFDHANKMGSTGQGSEARVNNALAFAERVMASDTKYLKMNPGVQQTFERLKGQNRHYLAHEYFNEDWHPMPFSKVSNFLSAAKLSYACSAHYNDNLDILNLNDAQKAILGEITDVSFRETVKDFICGVQFRRDYWVKGPRRLNRTELSEQLRALSFVLLTQQQEVAFKTSGHLGEVSLNEAIYGPIVEAMGDHKPLSIGELEARLQPKGITIQQLLQAIGILAGKGDIVPVQDGNLSKIKTATDKLNLHLMKRARGSDETKTLASPVVGGGAALNRFQQLFLLALREGKKTPQEWAEATWAHLQALGQRITKSEKVLETPEENLAELLAQAKEFEQKKLPILKTLKVL